MHRPSNDNLDQPAQFSLKAVFAVTTMLAIVLGASHWIGVGGVVSVVVVLLLVAAAMNIAVHHTRFAAVASLGCLGLIALTLLTAVLSESGMRTAARRVQCANNLKQIGIALHNYADVYGCFPPAYLADAKGQPMHSWRVLILPYIEQQALYDQYDFNEPWDGPHNRLLAKQIPYWFQCPSDSLLRGTRGACYLAITGPQTIWAGDAAATFDDISDGTANTLAVVEVAGSRIHWMEPRDLPFSALKLGVNPPTGGRVGSEHPDIAQVLFCDGSVRALVSAISAKTMQALATRSGGETIDEGY